MTTPLAQRALEIAVAELGKGEDPPGSNRGRDLDRWRIGGRTGQAGDNGAWCAAFLSYCFRMAAVGLRTDLPFKTSGGAKRLTKDIGEAGRFLIAPEVGAVICWHRGKLGPLDWRGHIGIIADYQESTDLLSVVEGNKLSRVALFAYPATWRRRLYRMATI